MKKKHDVVIILFGSNDATLKELSKQHISIEEYAENLKMMIKRLREKNPQVCILLLSPPPLHASDREAYGRSMGYEEPVVQTKDSVTSSYAHVCQRVAREEGVAFINLWTEMTNKAKEEGEEVSLFLVDGLHFNERGNAFVATRVTEQLSSMGFDSETMPLHQLPYREFFS